MKMSEFEMKYIPIFKDGKRTLLSMPDEILGHLIKNLIRYSDGEELVTNDFGNQLTDLEKSSIEDTQADMIRRYDLAVENCRKNSINGSKGGRPKAKQKPTKSQTKANKKPNESQTKATNTNTNTNIKKTYGECANVYLTEEEHSKIVNEGLTGLIEELSLYIASKGDKYKSHYAVIKQWAMRRKREQAEKEKPKSNQFTQGVMSRDIDFTDLEKKLIKN